MTSLHILCSLSETFSLRRLDLESRLCVWIMTILTENALILRDPGGAMLELESALKLLELRICRELLASPFNLGVMKFSGWTFGGYIIEREIGCIPKKDFLLSSHRIQGLRRESGGGVKELEIFLY